MSEDRRRRTDARSQVLVIRLSLIPAAPVAAHGRQCAGASGVAGRIWTFTMSNHRTHALGARVRGARQERTAPNFTGRLADGLRGAVGRVPRPSGRERTFRHEAGGPADRACGTTGAHAGRPESPR